MTEHIHLADKINRNAETVRPVCGGFDEPIEKRGETWTSNVNKVTCPKCRVKVAGA